MPMIRAIHVGGSLETTPMGGRGTTPPDAGAWAVGDQCSFGASLVIEGVTVDLEGQLARGRDTGAGRFVVPAFFVKGSYTMIRVP